MTRQEAWRRGTELLLAAQVADARWQAELLLRSALRENRARFLASLAEPADEEGLGQFWEWIRQRQQGVPLQYLVGKQEFMGLELAVTPAVLIPRPDTEVLVEEALRRLQGQSAPHVLDLATGSGAIALALAKHLPAATVWATDISLPALQVAQANAEQLGLTDRVKFLHGSWALPLDKQLRFHVITSNPPYIPSQEILSLSQEVQREPRLALDGGVDGLDCYRSLIPQAAPLLVQGGALLLEVGQGQAEQVADLMIAAGLQALATLKDLAGIQRVVVGEMRGLACFASP